jgi:HAD superfamily hydrolase (TIGR01509 family)
LTLRPVSPDGRLRPLSGPHRPALTPLRRRTVQLGQDRKRIGVGFDETAEGEVGGANRCQPAQPGKCAATGWQREFGSRVSYRFEGHAGTAGIVQLETDGAGVPDGVRCRPTEPSLLNGGIVTHRQRGQHHIPMTTRVRKVKRHQTRPRCRHAFRRRGNAGAVSELTLPERPAAILFDIDGTLVDSNYVHVVAWMYAFQSAGRHVEAWRIHEAIGMDSGELLQRLLGDEADEIGEQAKQEHSRRYAELSPVLQPFDGARELLRTVAARGVKVVLATSAPPDELERLRELLDVEEAIETVTNAEDVATAKPAPDIVQVALERAGVRADEAIFIGDAVWDVQAAGRAGVACIAVTSGGVHEAELRKAGAARLYPTVRDLLDDF